MWYQKDWFTGSDYYNLKEKQIHAEEIEIKKPVEQRFHEMTEIYYVKSGDADIWINGEQYQMQEGSFCCLYMHHFGSFGKQIGKSCEVCSCDSISTWKFREQSIYRCQVKRWNKFFQFRKQNAYKSGNRTFQLCSFFDFIKTITG